MMVQVMTFKCASCGAVYMGIVNERDVIKRNAGEIIEALVAGDIVGYAESSEVELDECNCPLSPSQEMERAGATPLFDLAEVG